jgi:hypothetical protein
VVVLGVQLLTQQAGCTGNGPAAGNTGGGLAWEMLLCNPWTMVWCPSFLPYCLLHVIQVCVILSALLCRLWQRISRTQTVDQLSIMWAGWQGGPRALQGALLHRNY